MALNMSEATRTVVLDVSKAFNRIWHTALLHNLKSYVISGQIFGFIMSFLSNRCLEKSGLFSDDLCCYKSSRSTLDCLTLYLIELLGLLTGLRLLQL